MNVFKWFKCRKQSKQRIQELEAMLQRLSAIQEPDGVWDWWIQNEIREIKKVA